MEIMFNNIKTMKMRKVKYLYGAGALIMALMIVQLATAQNKNMPNTVASVELLKARSLWFDSNNGAGLGFDNLVNFSTLDANYLLKSGDFKFVQDGENENILGFTSEGGRELGDAYAWGKFSYNNVTQKNTQFNTAMLNPHRGVPYFPTDPNLSDWKRQEYTLEMKVTTRPMWDRYMFGLQAKYDAHTGAKQVDPRSEVYYYTVNFKPGIAALFGNHKIGLNFEYENLSQETRRHTNSNNQVDQDVYVMRGLGNHYTAVIGGLQSLGSFLYKGNKIGGEVQYGYDFNNMRFFVRGGYDYRVEDVISSATKPKKEGSVKEQNIHANATLLIESDNLSRIEASYSQGTTSGIEYVQVIDNSFEVQRWIDVYSSIRSEYNQSDIAVKYDFYRGAEHEYKWKAALFANYRKNDDIYFVPESSRMVENLYVGVNGGINLPVNQFNRFMASAGITYKNNMDGLYEYNGVAPESIVITDFMTPDFEYMKQSYYKIGGEISYFAGLGVNKRSGICLKVAADYYKPTEGDGNRVIATFGVGFTF